MKKKFLVAAIFFCCINAAFATHNRAGEITFTHVSGLTYQAVVNTYANTCALPGGGFPPDREELTIYWGDGDSSVIFRTNGPIGSDGIPIGEQLCNCSKHNQYTGQHTYNGPGVYTLSMEDPNRNGGIENIPNSVNVPFYIYSVLTINPFLGYDNSPILLNPPSCISACANICFYYNCNAYDPDGDSLSYKLIPCKGHAGVDIFGYTYPPTTSTFSIDKYSGLLEWCSPSPCSNPSPCEYNVAILISEFRHGTFIGSVERDMQIDVTQDCIDNLPQITAPDTCVVAGTLVKVPIKATDSDVGQLITLNVTGYPFSLTPPATWSSPPASNPINTVFTWQTNCTDVRTQPYVMSVQATDNYTPPLSNFQSFNVTVVGPAPTGLTAIPLGSSIKLTWNASTCPQVIGYNIYRRDSCSTWQHGPCEVGVPSYTGYTLIATVTGINNTTYIDNNNGSGLVHGVQYSYIVDANYPPPDAAVSYASNQVCLELTQDVPIITNVSVDTTDFAVGKILIKWIKPLADSADLDTITNPGPYSFVLMRGQGFSPSSFTAIKTFTSTYFADWNDITYTDTLLDTQDNPYTYRIDFSAGGGTNFIGSTSTASSIFLTSKPASRKVNLSWSEHVPWTNYQYQILKQNPITKIYSLIATTTLQHYTDSLYLKNDSNYCYKIQSIGAYSLASIPHPLYNFSEKRCETPIDTVPPCPPKLVATADCNLSQNTLVWTNPNNSCCTDAKYYTIYFTPVENTPFQVLTTINNLSDTTYVQNNLASLAGCYAVTATDSTGNQSAFSNIVCVDNCPQYQLPNVFTPDNDGKNDFYIPIPPVKYIKDIDIKIYNRWGEIVFETSDPAIKWDGTNQSDKKKCAEGTYFYICTVNEIRVSGIKPVVLKGFIELLRNKNGGTGQ
ncbi:MAG TPA: gliding motility-associated C-terminal domain-containing protein [Bacteroidia bacterium]|nr:gliding motility-associated C-terminal domain-containing protein [Bacteroidia bacterium]